LDQQISFELLLYDACAWPMAENIYSKGTRVWFEDKDQAWISAEVTSFTKAPDDSIKLVFLDERGKVRTTFLATHLLFTQRMTKGNHSKYH
jgi:hypothetical protein